MRQCRQGAPEINRKENKEGRAHQNTWHSLRDRSLQHSRGGAPPVDEEQKERGLSPAGAGVQPQAQPAAERASHVGRQQDRGGAGGTPGKQARLAAPQGRPQCSAAREPSEAPAASPACPPAAAYVQKTGSPSQGGHSRRDSTVRACRQRPEAGMGRVSAGLARL